VHYKLRQEYPRNERSISRTIDRVRPILYARPSGSFARTCKKFEGLDRSSRQIDRSS
jgi:hypothetical protein